MAEQSRVDAETLTARTEELIREGIIDGRYAPGSRLRERDLSAELGVSRVPVREALSNLAFQGFVDIAPRRGAMVREMSLRDVSELFDLRLALETLTAREAARAHRDGAPHEGLAVAMEQARRATSAGDRGAILVANANFHVQLVDAATHRLLAETMTPILARTRWLFAQTADRDPEGQCREHHEIYEAVCAGQIELAGMYAASHVESGRRPSLRSLQDTGRVTKVVLAEPSRHTEETAL